MKQITDFEMNKTMALEDETEKEQETVNRIPLWQRIGEMYFCMSEKYGMPRPVNRKKYLYLCLLGIVGANQFYAGHWVKGLGYLALSWTGIPITLGFIDWMTAVPKEPDETGMIMM